MRGTRNGDTDSEARDKYIVAPFDQPAPPSLHETPSTIEQLIKAALPHREIYIQVVGPTGYDSLLGELEIALLNELRSAVTGESADETNVDQAANIAKAVGAVHNEIETAQRESESTRSANSGRSSQ